MFSAMLGMIFSYIWRAIDKIAFIFFFFLGTKSGKGVEFALQMESFYIFPHEPSLMPVDAAAADIHSRNQEPITRSRKEGKLCPKADPKYLVP